MSLPELPEPAGVVIVGTQAMRAFTADQMLAYGKACRDAALEEASDAFFEALQRDLENGVKWLSELESYLLKERYPQLSKFGETLNALKDKQ